MRTNSTLRFIWVATITFSAVCASSFAARMPDRTSHARPCREIIASAVAKAKGAHKQVFVKFGSSWCRPCNDLEALLKSKPMWSVLGRHFAFVSIHYEEDKAHQSLENPGAVEWMRNAGVVPSLPAYAILDDRGKVVTCSSRPSNKLDLQPVTGLPFTYVDVEAFLHLVAEGAPGVTDQELKKIRRILEDSIQGKAPR